MRPALLVALVVGAASAGMLGCSKGSDEQSVPRPPPPLPSGAPHAESAGAEPLPVTYRMRAAKSPRGGPPAPSVVPAPPVPDL